MHRLQIDPQRWTELNELLDTALDLPPAQRDLWLDSLDRRHESLKPQLRTLLERIAWVETQDFLDKLPPLEASGAMSASEPHCADQACRSDPFVWSESSASEAWAPYGSRTALMDSSTGRSLSNCRRAHGDAPS